MLYLCLTTSLTLQRLRIVITISSKVVISYVKFIMIY